MKKSILLFLFLFEGTSFLFGQSFPVDSTTWHYLQEDFSGPSPVIYQIDYIILNDTVVNNISYTKVICSRNGEEFMYRIDTLGRIWARYLDLVFFQCTDTNDILIYDFSLSTGDSIYIHNCYSDSFLCVVSITDSISTNYGNRKEIKFSDESLFTCLTSDTMIWIEGVGSYNDLFYNLNFFRPGLVCESRFYFSYLESHGQFTNLTTYVNSKVADPGIYFDSNNIIHSDSFIEEISIYDVLGKSIYSVTTMSKEVYIPDIYLNGGLKIIRLKIEGRSISLKVIRG